VQLKETLEVIDGTLLIFSDLQSQMSKDFYSLFVKSTDTAFIKKQNSFVLFKTNLNLAHKDKKTLFTLANCYFRLKNLVHDQLPEIQFLSEIERDGDLVRLKELEKEQKVLNMTQNLRNLEKIIDQGGQDGQIENKDVDKWVQQSIADCVLKFRKSVTKAIENNTKGPSFRSKFKSQQLRQSSGLNCFLFNLDKQGKNQKKGFINSNPQFIEDLDSHLLLFYRLLAIKYRLANPLSGGKPWVLSNDLSSILETRIVSAGLKYFVLLRTCTKKKETSKKLQQPRFK
jgi:preprotein translocase subunit YajC